MNQAAFHLSIIGDDNEWETPRDIFEEACKKYGHSPTLDVCAREHSTKCHKYFGLDHINPARRNALDVPWREDFFCNPPYEHPILEKFLEHGIKQCLGEGVTGLFLVYAKVDTHWWHDYVEESDFIKVHFHPRRIQFEKFGFKPRRCSHCRITLFQESHNCPQCNKTTNGESAPYPNAWLSIKP